MKTERKTAYVVHPVTPEQKMALSNQGYKVLDARHAPEGVEVFWFDDDGEMVSGESAVAQESTNEPSAEPQEPDEDERKQELIAELKEYGVNKDMRTGLDKLEELLAEAKGAE